MTGTDPRSRRSFLAKGLATVGALSIPGCQNVLTEPLSALCPNDPAISDKSTPLTIDVHAHVFNGSDLQVARFIDLVVVHQHDALAKGIELLADLIQHIVWHLAPDAKREIDGLGRLQAEFAECKPAALAAKLDVLRQEGYALARAQLQSALDAQRPAAAPVAGSFADLLALEARAPTPTARADLVIRNLPQSYADYRRQRTERARTAPKSQATLSTILDFVIQVFQYRFVSVDDYLRTFSTGASRRIDLLVTSILDFDWWLAKGDPTASSLDDQIRVMEKIAIVTGGRVHAFAPFCPLREVASRMGKSTSALAMAKDAVCNRGCIGVKLYPPLGFAPYGNAALDKWQDKDWLPDIARAPGFGAQLDSVLGEFFRWCIDEQVPVLAHTNTTNGPSEDFQELTSADHWRTALDTLDVGAQNLRVNFGHFGDTTLASDSREHGPNRARAFMDLMRATPGEPGAKAYADAAYFVEVIDDFGGLQGALGSLLDRSKDGLLSRRLMYGSDWLLSIADVGISNYLSDFETLIRGLQGKLAAESGPALVENFFGRNAADFLGLRKGEMNRLRLDRFYAGRVDTPDWMRKVDDLT